ncbi:MAG: type I-E CRISPR-associated protein Cas5/CasD [Planctomycetota bacterium]
MSGADNTLFLRLAGPMQSWGTSSRFQLRRTDAYPSKSGVLGLVLCAMGIRREGSPRELKPLVLLAMGVRVDCGGTLDWDYHTAGAKIGIWQADRKKLKRTASTGELETLLSHRQYLYDASFLVALHGPADAVSACVGALDNPVWPVFLGRKCCIPAEPVFAGTGSYDSVFHALSRVPWRPRIEALDCDDWCTTRTLQTFVEHPPGSAPPADALLVYDVPRAFGFHSHGARWIVAGQVNVDVGEATQKPVAKLFARRVDYTSPQWKAARLKRLNFDHHLCVFCKSPAVEVHHVDYTNVGCETDSDLRSLCKICHDACTMLEYGHDMRLRWIDPSDPAQRPAILRQIDRLLSERRLGRRRELLASARTAFFDDVFCSSQVEGR